MSIPVVAAITTSLLLPTLLVPSNAGNPRKATPEAGSQVRSGQTIDPELAAVPGPGDDGSDGRITAAPFHGRDVRSGYRNEREPYVSKPERLSNTG